MTNLEYFINNELEDEVMDIIIYNEDGSELKDPKYKDYYVTAVKYEEKEDGKYCTINVRGK